MYAIACKEQCIVLFPVPYEVNKHRRIKTKIIHKMIDTGIDRTFIYHPEKTKTKFYLTLLPTYYIQYTILLTDDY